MFVSYAQNFEDVMLWRALKHIKHGFYIDIGSQDPVVDSVSLAFYKQGWRGVHVEPSPQYARKIREARPEETVEQVAIGDVEGPMPFYEFCYTGLSTAVPGIAEHHQKNGFKAIKIEVPVLFLDELLEKYNDKMVHWLKIDVEGMEKSVLRSWRSSKCRPWILVVESTIPLTQVEGYKEWEQLVVDKGYEFSYFDGLNRFYVHDDHLDLKKHFSSPPNIFDDFALSGSASQPFWHLIDQRAQLAEDNAVHFKKRAVAAEAQAQQLEQRAVAAEVQAQQLEQRAVAVEAQVHQLEQRTVAAESMVACLVGSRSWRITLPLRLFAHLIRWGRNRIFSIPCNLQKAIKALLKPAFARVISFAASRPALKHRLVALVRKFPTLDARLRRFAIARGLIHPVVAFPELVPEGSPVGLDLQNCEHLTPYARRIYADLKAAIEAKSLEEEGR